MKLKNWMIALDLTEMDPLLLEYVKFMAETMEPDQITILHIMETYQAGREYKELFPGRLESLEEIRQLILEELEEKVAALPNRDRVSIEIVEGDTTDAMIQSIRKHDPDLLVLGKKTGYEGQGVIARKVVRYVPCPVLFVPETARGEISKVLVPVNFNEHSAGALRFAASLADTYQAELTAVHVYQYPPQFFPGIPVDEFRETMKPKLDEKLNEFRNKYQAPEQAEYRFVLNQSKKVPDMVYDQSIREHADLIVVGARNRATLSNVLMDDLADRMIQYAYGIPLLIFKEKKKYKGLIESFFLE